MRTKTLISYPRYNRNKGDLTKRWYVEFAFRLPTTDKQHRYRVYTGLCSGTAEERDRIAAQLVDYYTKYLKSGEYLNQEPNLNPLKESEDHRPEQKRYTAAKKSVMINTLINRYLTFINDNLRPKTCQDYRSKLLVFADWANIHLPNVPVPAMQRSMLIPFFEMLSTKRKLCRCTNENYMQIVRAFFNYCEDIGVRAENTNPIRKIPKFGRVIDCSPGVFDADERIRLRNTIKDREPFLWLACEMLYYCAVRPGTEMRLLKVGDIDFENRNIRIRAELAKNKTTELVGMPIVLVQYMLDLNLDILDKNLYIFGRCGSPSSIPTGKNTLRNRFNHYRDLLQISKDKKFYSWKHTGAISAAQNGASVFEIKDQLRHKSVQTTEEYLKKRQPKIGAAAQKMDEL